MERMKKVKFLTKDYSQLRDGLIQIAGVASAGKAASKAVLKNDSLVVVSFEQIEQVLLEICGVE